MPIPSDFFLKFKDEEMLQTKMKEIKPVLKIVKNFFIEKKIIIYGGTAMNMYLPREKQFYDKYDIPDYDGFNNNAKDTSIELINILKKKDYRFLMVKHAIHDGTYKVSWTFKDIADITNINQAEYDHIFKTSIKKNGLYLCNINLLKSNAYVELGMPKSSMFRWEKVYNRLMLLEGSYKNKSIYNIDNIFNDELIEEIQPITNDLINLIKRNKYPLVGFEGVKYYLNISKKNIKYYNTNFTIIEILSDNIYETATDIIRLLGKYKKIEYEKIVKNTSELIPSTIEFNIFINKKKYKWLKIFDVTKNCFSIQTCGDNIVYGSVFFLLYIYYYYLFANTSTIKENVYKCVINELIKKISEKDFTSVCYGINKSVSVIKKSRIMKKKAIVVAKS